MVLPTSSPHRVGLLVGICWTNSQRPHYSPGLGRPWLQMISALLLWLKIKFCLFVLHIPTHYPKNDIWRGEIFLLFDNLVGIQFLSNIFPASSSFLQKSIVENIIAVMNAKDQVIIQSRSMADCVIRCTYTSDKTLTC